MEAGAGSSHDRVRTGPQGCLHRGARPPARAARISLFDLKRGENATGGFPLASPLEVPPVLSIPIIHRFVLFVRSASARKPRSYASAEALCGLPAPGLAMRRHSMESRETVRALPTLQLFRLPSRQSCATRAVLTPSISAASVAVTAGMSESPTLIAKVTTVSQSKSNNGHTPRTARATLRRPQSCKATLQDWDTSCNPTLQDLPQTICNPTR